MKRFKTVVGRIAYQNDFEKAMDKAAAKLAEEKAEIVDIKTCVGDNWVLALIEYRDYLKPETTKKKLEKKAASKNQSTKEQVDGQSEATTA